MIKPSLMNRRRLQTLALMLIFFSASIQAFSNFSSRVAAGNSIPAFPMPAVTAEGSWQSLVANDLTTAIARSQSSFIEVGGKFYLIGGLETSAVSIYDPAFGGWSSGSSSPVPLHHFQAVTYQGLIYVMGAFTTGDTPATAIYIYNPASDSWTEGPAIPRPRGAAGVVAVNNKFYMIGGLTNGHVDGWVKWVDQYDPATLTWTTLADAPRERDHFQAVAINSTIYLAGGRKTNASGTLYSGTVAEVDVYDVNNSYWYTLPSSANLINPRAGAATVVLNNEIHVLGGENSTSSVALTATHIFDPVKRLWRQSATMLSGRHGTGALVSNSIIYVAGGSSTRGESTALSTIDYFTPNVVCAGSPTSPTLDDDFDGFKNDDETLNGTNKCLNTSFPSDFDGDKISDLKDTDDDGDGVLDTADAFPFDSTNGLTTTLPVNLTFNKSGLALTSSGLTGLMSNGTDYLNNYIRTNPDFVIGGSGLVKIPAFPGGPSTNNQKNALQAGVAVTSASGIVNVKSRLVGIPFFSGVPVNQLQDQSQGIYIGSGDQDNFLAVSLDANSGDAGIRVYGENGGVSFINALTPVSGILDTDALFLYIEIDPLTKVARAYYQTGSALTRTQIGSDIGLPSFINNIVSGSKALAAGLIASSGTSSDRFIATYDYLQVITNAPYVEQGAGFYNRYVGNPTTPAFTLDLNTVFNDNNGVANLTYSILSVGANTFIQSSAISGNVLTVNFNGVELGSTNVVIQATDGDGNTGVYQFTLRVLTEPVPFLKINAGEGGYRTWAADNYYSGGVPSTIVVAVANTEDDFVFQTERFGNQFTYSLPVPQAGYYRVNLHFAEVYHGIRNSLGVGARTFNVDAEGQNRLAAFDIFKEAGGAAKAIVKSLDSVYVTDGFATIKFTAIVNEAKVSGIELLGYALTNVPNSAPVIQNPGNQTVYQNSNFTLQLAGADLNATDVLTFSATGLPTGIQIDAATGLLSGIVTANANTYPVTVTVTDQLAASSSATFNIVVTQAVSFVKRINAGGTAQTYGSESWSADESYSVNTGTSITVVDITNTTKDEIYQAERYGTVSPFNFTYDIPVPGAGKYLTTLHFAEVFFSSANQRLFNVDIESGKGSLTNYDIFTAAGGKNLAKTETFLIEVTDGTLNINFNSITGKNKAKISGIEISSCVDPIINSVSSGNLPICSGSSATITVNGSLGSATSWKLYSGSCGGTLVSTNTTGIFTVNPTATTTYFVRAEGGCITPVNCAEVTVNVYPASTITSITADPIAICSGNSTTLTVNGVLGSATSWKLFSGSCGGTLLATSQTGIFTVSPTVTTTYYVSADGGCSLVPNCTSIQVSVNTNVGSITSVISNTPSVCSGSSASITVNGSLGGSTSWNLYSGSCGGTLIASSAFGVFSVSPTQTTTYYVRAEGGCFAAGSCSTVTIGVTQSSQITSVEASGTSVCKGETVTLTVNGSLGSATNWRLFSGSCGGTPIASNASGIFEVIPTQSTNYYINAEGGCNNAGACTLVAISVITLNANLDQTANTLTAVTSNAAYAWIDCATDQPVAGATGQSFSPGVSGSYKLQITQNGCTAFSDCFDFIFTGLNDLSANRVTLYPNPVKDELYLNLPNGVKPSMVSVTDMTGKQKKIDAITNGAVMQLDVRSLSAGFYLISVKSANAVQTIKFIKQ